jgi:carbon storage regulator
MMLVLSRKAGEEIVLPNRGVTIGVVAVKGGQVRLGITAPAEVSVHRGEVRQRTGESRLSGPDVPEADGKALRVLVADADQANGRENRQKVETKTAVGAA